MNYNIYPIPSKVGNAKSASVISCTLIKCLWVRSSTSIYSTPPWESRARSCSNISWTHVGCPRAKSCSSIWSIHPGSNPEAQSSCGISPTHVRCCSSFLVASPSRTALCKVSLYTSGRWAQRSLFSSVVEIPGAVTRFAFSADCVRVTPHDGALAAARNR